MNEHPTERNVYGTEASDWAFTRRDYNTSEGKRDQWHCESEQATVDVGDDGTLTVWISEPGHTNLAMVQVPAAVFRAMAERRLSLDLSTINEGRGGYALPELEADEAVPRLDNVGDSC